MAAKNAKSVLQFIVLLSIGVLLIWLSLKQVAPEKDKIIDAFETANYFWVFLAMLVSLISHVIRGIRWNDLLKPAGHRTDPFNAVCHVLVGYLANYGIPRMGEVSRCTLASKYDKVPFEVGFGTVITERIVDFFIFLIIFFLTLLFQFSELIGLANELIFDKLRARFSGASGEPSRIVIPLVICVGFVFVMWLLRKKFASLLRGKLGNIIKGMFAGLGSIRNLESPFRFIFLSLLMWACYFYTLYLCFFALPGTSGLGHKEGLTLLLFGTFGVIFSPGGLGAYPAIVGGILMYTYNIDMASAFALPWLAWTSQFLLVLALGLISLVVLPIHNRKKNVVPQAAD